MNKKFISLINTVALMAATALPVLPAHAANPQTVTVSATVASILTLSVDNSSLDLGTLDGTFAGNADNTTATVSTNAVSGGQLDVTSGGLASASREIGAQDLNAAAPTGATDYYKISTNATPAFDTTDNVITAAGGRDMRASQTVYDGTGPVSGATQLVTVSAQIDTALTEVGAYADSLVFTLTANL